MTSDVIEIVREADGTHRLADGMHPPAMVSFSAELVDALRKGASPWAAVVTEHGQDHETIVMCLSDRTLTYRLTGEVDLTDGLVAVFIPEVKQ